MEEKKKTKISIKQTILAVIAILVVIFGIVFYIYHRAVTPSSNITSTTGMTSTTTRYEDTKQNAPTVSNTQYDELNSYMYISSYSDLNIENIFVTSKQELRTYLFKCLGTQYIDIELNDQKLLEYFDDEFFKDNNLAIEMHDGSSSHHHYTIVSVTKEGTTGTINIKDNASTYGGVFTPNIEFSFIVLDKDITNVKFDIYQTTTNNSYESDFGIMFIAGIVITILVIIIVSIIVIIHNRKVENKPKTHSIAKKIIYGIIITVLILIAIFFIIVFYEATMMPNMTVYKPIIYLYPTDDIELSVKLGYEDKITCSYPQYKTSWNVLAKTSSDLIDLNTNRTLYALYYESEAVYDFEIQKDGFIVKGSDITKFLEEKLEMLGLTERETEEFIVYWLPILQENEYNYIRFATTEEINQNMPLEFSVQPDTLIRVLMTYKGLDKPFDVEEQQLETPERTGFVAVEWGGTEIN